MTRHSTAFEAERPLPADDTVKGLLPDTHNDASNGATAFTFLGWRIDFRLRELRNPAGARVAMTSAEFDLLRTFCERPGRVLSRDSLLDLTQGRNAGSFERSIDVLVSRIRRKIETDPLEPTMIKTVRSGGYMFTPRVDAVTIPTNG